MSEFSSFIPYPWHQPHWQSFLQQYEQQRLPHAMLLSGQKGVGKWHYAHTMADFLLCAAPRSGLACGECRSCKLNHSSTHPDKSVIIPEEPGKQIKIDQVRQLSARIASTAQQGGRKVIILGPVEKLNTNAANALLKNLEEPSKDTFFILYSHVASGVIATIRSRCQLFAIPAPDKSSSIQWLQELGFSENIEPALDMSANSPLLAKSLLDNDELIEHLQQFLVALLEVGEVDSKQFVPNLALVKTWLEIDLIKLLEWWVQLIYLSIQGLYRSDDKASSESNLLGPMLRIKTVVSSCNQQWLFRFVDKLLLSKQQLLRGANPNKQLLLEELLLDWYAIIKTARTSAHRVA
ncbi:MAG: DNA polymerase-3 subunit delta' [Cellvibrionaceae bacterium]|jgi:DNA polymerase-3 subunit delta'